MQVGCHELSCSRTIVTLMIYIYIYMYLSFKLSSGKVSLFLYHPKSPGPTDGNREGSVEGCASFLGGALEHPAPAVTFCGCGRILQQTGVWGRAVNTALLPRLLLLNYDY